MKTIVVNGVNIKVRPYTLAREEKLMEVGREINDFVDANPTMDMDAIPRKKRAEWWKRKADTLWEAERPLGADFFESKDFEVQYLKETEDFFLIHRYYL